MTTHAAFLQAICANPDDDTPRLVYADWLEEHGEAARAEFIRVQCELARLDSQRPMNPKVFRERFRPLQFRERELHEAHGYGWCGDLLGAGWKVDGIAKIGPATVAAVFFRGNDRTARLNLSFRRGFVGDISLGRDDLLDYGPQLVQATPLERVEVVDRAPCRASEVGRSWFWYKHVTGFVPLTDGGIARAPVVPAEWWPRENLGFMVEFDSEAAAHTWLSERALLWCRSEAVRLATPEVTD